MKNKFVRLFVVLSKLMTAEKMKLDRFVLKDEFFAYNISVDGYDLSSSTRFSMQVDVDNTVYTFSNEEISEKKFSIFEKDLSRFLNVLFDRKQEFEHNRDNLDNIVGKLNTLTTEERQQLATYIDSTPEMVLSILGIADRN